MTWAKLDDGFWMNPKVLIAGNTAAGVFARMLSYCGCYLTDGRVPEEVVQTIIGKDKAALASLERLLLISQLPSGAYEIPDFLEHNRSKAQVEADRLQRKEAGKRGGQKRAGSTENGASREAVR
jgi:hypothetical protein